MRSKEGRKEEREEEGGLLALGGLSRRKKKAEEYIIYICCCHSVPYTVKIKRLKGREIDTDIFSCHRRKGDITS